VLIVTESGAAAKTTDASPPPVMTVAVVEARARALSGPPPVSALSGPARPSSVSDPPPVMTVSGPLIFEALTGPLPESRFAPAIPDTVIGPPWVATVAVTSGGTATAKLTLQSKVSHAGSARLRRPSDTDCSTAGAPLRGPPGADCGWVGTALATTGPAWLPYVKVSVIRTVRPLPRPGRRSFARSGW
jgi:hypothetical protein